MSTTFPAELFVEASEITLVVRDQHAFDSGGKQQLRLVTVFAGTNLSHCEYVAADVDEDWNCAVVETLVDVDRWRRH